MAADAEYAPAKVSEVGFVDEAGAEGVLLLRSESDRQTVLAMSSLPGEKAVHVERFSRGDRSSVPTAYNLVEELAERNGLHLAKVQVHPSRSVLKAKLHFKGREEDLVLDGYRASDAVAMATLFDAPILVERSLLQRRP